MDWIAISAAVALLLGIVAAALLLPRIARALRAGPTPDDRPLLTDADLDRIEAEVDRMRLPLCRLVPTAERSTPMGTRLGGRPWSPFATDRWPTDPNGRPMLFLAQVNFEELPALDGFPESGLLQLFVLSDERGGLAGGDSADDGGRVLRWFPRPHGGAVLPVPDPFLQRRTRSPLRGSARDEGVALRGEADRLPPTDSVARMEEITREVVRGRPADAGTGARVGRWWESLDEVEDRYGTHWIGGHPSFVQDDVRSDPALSELDRVLLHLGSDEHLEIGDSGQINVLIRRTDLTERRFDRAYYTWDGN